jgi:hypothetical protein
MSGNVTRNTDSNAWPLGDAFTGKLCAADDVALEPHAVPRGNKHAWMIDLGADVWLNGTLHVDLCVDPALNTLMFVSTQCPTLPASAWDCTLSNDDSSADCGW